MSMEILTADAGDLIAGHPVPSDRPWTWCPRCRVGDEYRTRIGAELAQEKHNRDLHAPIVVPDRAPSSWTFDEFGVLIADSSRRDMWAYQRDAA